MEEEVEERAAESCRRCGEAKASDCRRKGANSAAGSTKGFVNGTEEEVEFEGPASPTMDERC